MPIFQILAQAAAAASPEATAQQGVTSYPAAFFATQQPANAAEMVERVPGFILDGGSGARGFEGSAGNVLIDGQRPASKTDDLEQILRRIPAGRVERIDLIRGGAPGIDMQGKSVVANIIRKSGGGARLLVAGSQNHTTDGRTVGAGRLEASGDWGPRRWELAGFAGKHIDDWFGNGRGGRINSAGTLTPVAVEGEGEEVNGQVTGAFETPALGGTLRLNGRIFDMKYKGEETDLLSGALPTREDTLDIVYREETELGGTFSRKFGARTEIELVGLRQTGERDIHSSFADGTGAATFNLARETTETIGRAVLKYRFTDRFSLEGGGEIAINELDSLTGLIANGAPVKLPAANVGVQEDRTELFAKASWRPTDRWTFDASLRRETSEISSDGDVILSKTLHFLKPRVSAAWDISKETQVRARFEREVGQLDFDDFVATANLGNASGVTAGNPDLDPEQAWVGEVTVEQRFWASGSATLTFRHSELSDVVDRGPVTAPNGTLFDRPENIGDGTKDELIFALSLPLKRLGVPSATLRGDITKRWSKVTDPTTFESREISDLRPIEWSLNYTHDLTAWRLSYGMDAWGSWRETSYRYNQTYTTKLRTYVRPFMEWRPQPALNIRFELPNITARGLRRTVTTYPGSRAVASAPAIDDRTYEAGRMFYFRVRKTFGG